MSGQNSSHPRILQVSTSDTGGGAERVALDLHSEYRRRGIQAALALGSMSTECAGCIEIPNDESRSVLVRTLVNRLPEATDTTALRIRQFGRSVAEPGRALRHMRGLDDFDYPGTQRLLGLAPWLPEIVHLHNLHGGYFDLRFLPALSAAVPAVVTLHDTWMLSGHCAYYLDCERWLTGCGQCPYPGNPPAMPRDASAQNWRMKRNIYLRSRLHLVGPSLWILDAASRSIIAPAIESTSLVRNGVDQSLFAPGDRNEARRSLGLPLDASVVMFAANNVNNVYKDFATLLAAVPSVAALIDRPLLVLAVGGKEPLPGLDERMVRLVPFTDDRATIARHLQAADVFVHATRADNYPLTTLEAQSCGIPVVVTDVGGAAETIVAGKTGLTYPPGDASALAEALAHLLVSDAEREAMGASALVHARTHHSLARMADDYLALYDHILERRAR